MTKKILVLNSGSSSLKYQLFEVHCDNGFKIIAKGGAERIGIDGSFIKHRRGDEESQVLYRELPNHEVAINKLLKLLEDPEMGVMKSVTELDGVGHRVVHGGEDFSESVLITDKVKRAIHENSVLAPLHNPPNLLGIEAVEHVLPEVPQVAVFDTAVHQTMPEKAYLYGLPKAQYTVHKIRRYGFHGTSHGYVCREAMKRLGQPSGDLKIITCHLGNGGSITAFRGGKSVDTSMGLTPLEGIVMGTRAGSMDPYIPLHLMESQGLSIKEVNGMMNKEGGLLGLCGKSDMRDLLDAVKRGEKSAQTALDVFIYRIQKLIGSYVAALNGVDAVVFTAGIGENNPVIRTLIMEHFGFLGIQVDKRANEAGKVEISTRDSRVKVLVIPTDEEKVIAEDTYRIIS